MKWSVNLSNVYHVNSTDWNKDWKPGPYPKTDAERIAAAKKYGLLPQDYEPYPDDGLGYGDYPKLPIVSADMKDSLYNWDYPEMKRDFGEPVNIVYFLKICIDLDITVCRFGVRDFNF